MNEYIIALKQNPIFQMSLGSKELFHSNFIAWILESEKLQLFAKEFVKQFTGIENIETIVAPKREKQNIDLQFTVKLTDGVEILIVIENKVKSLPYLAQLNEYENKIDKKTDIKPDFYLLSLTKPIFNTAPWKYKSYSELAIAMSKSIDKVYDKDLKVIINYYLDFIRNLDILSEDMIIDFKNELFDYSISRKPYQEIRLHDLYLKIKHQQIANKIGRILKEDKSLQISFFSPWVNNLKSFPTNNNGGYYIGSGFTRSQGLIDFKYIPLHFKLKNSNDILYLILGVQLQGTQLRYVTEIWGDKLSTESKKLAQKLSILIANIFFDDKKWIKSAQNIIDLDDSNIFNGINLGKGRIKSEDNKNEFCSYNNIFFYKYDIININTKVSNIVSLFEELAKYLVDNKSYFEKVLKNELKKIQ